MSLPKSYKAAIVEGPKQGLKIVERELKAPGAGEILVKIQASSICFSDHYCTLEGGFPIPWPMAPGHEGVGKIAAVGPGVDEKAFAVGTQVGLGWSGGYCGFCDACRRGQFHWCTKGWVTGVTIEGCHQEYVLTKPSAIVFIPKEVQHLKPSAIAPLLCAGITVYDAIKYAGDVAKPGDLVAVQGIGGLGHLALQMAVAAGYRVAAISSSKAKADLAKKLGAAYHFTADEAVRELQKLGGAKAIIGTAPNASAVNSIFEGLGPYGKLILVGIPADGSPYTIPSLTLTVQRRSVCGLTCGSAINNEDTLRYAAQIGINPQVKEWKLDQAGEAFTQTLSGKAEGRNVIVFE